MASIPVTIVGVLTYTGLEVGGGPMPGGPPNVIWPSPGYPAHPIAPGGSPGYPAHPIAPGGGVVSPPIYYPNVPTHPIAPGGPGGPPNVIWPSPGVPAHPIFLPPDTPGGPPNVIWPSPGVPTHPIAPGGTPGDGGGGGGGMWAYSPVYGWVWLPAGGGDKPHPPQLPTEPQE